MEFTWWAKDPAGEKFQIKARYHGGAIQWRRQQGRFTDWKPHSPEPKDWEKLIADAERRVPRRLVSPKQFEAIRRCRGDA